MDASSTHMLRQIRTVLPICFICNLPILSHQVGLVWHGVNAWDELVRGQIEETTLRQRLQQFSKSSDLTIQNLAKFTNSTTPRGNRRRRSSLAQLTDVIKEWTGGGSKSKLVEIDRRETLADLVKGLPWKSNGNPPSSDVKEFVKKNSKKYKKSNDSDTDKSITHELKRKMSRLLNRTESFRQKFISPPPTQSDTIIDISRKPSSNPKIEIKQMDAVNYNEQNNLTSPIEFARPTSPLPIVTDSSTQLYSSPERHRTRLQRQNTIFDENLVPEDEAITQTKMCAARRSSLSPDSAAHYYRSMRSEKSIHLSPERKRNVTKLHRRSYTLKSHSSRDISPVISPVTSPQTMPRNTKISVRRQSTTTEEILIATGFRRQSTTEELLQSRNFRRQSSQSDDFVRYKKDRRDSSSQITDGTLRSMHGETTCPFYDSGNRIEPSPTYDNNHYHEECLKCTSCGANLTGTQQKRARRVRNQIFCDLHFADVALMECSDFMQQLRSFKPQSLGCAVARRKSSTTFIFPLPPQACSDEFCEEYPHKLTPMPGYWIECSRRKITGYDSTSLLDDNNIDEIQNDTDDDLEDLKSNQELNKGTETLNFENCPKKTLIEEQWDSIGGFELTSVEQETYEKYFYGREHWNYFTNDEDLGPVILSIKQETLNSRDQFRVLIRAISYTVHGLIPTSCVFADRYNREEVVRSLGKEVGLNPPLVLGQLPDTSEELLKLDQVFIKSELKVGVIYVCEDQYTEEEILDNNCESPLFSEFLTLIGERVQLRGFDKYKGGLDTVHDLTGSQSIYTNWRNIEIMFHVSTMLPYEKHDLQKLQRKRHIGNDIVCVVFLEAENTPFSPTCIKSHFLHTFIIVRTCSVPKNKVTKYELSVVTRDEVGAYKPYLWEQSTFEASPMFREWILTKIVNGERASYAAPKFARMQERTRSQMLEDIVANLQNHVETGQIPKPYRRGSWRPIGHMRPSSPLLDSVKDLFEDDETLGKDFTKVFMNSEECLKINQKLFDVTFLVGQSKEKEKVYGVRAILGVRSRVFQEMLYGIQTGLGSAQVPVVDILSRPAPVLLSPKNVKSKNNFLQVPGSDSTTRPKSVPNSPIVKRAISRIGNFTSNWGKSIRKSSTQSQQLLVNDERKKSNSSQESITDMKESREKLHILDLPKLSMCADIQKVDKTKLAQHEFPIIEFDGATFRILLDYLHTGSCALTCVTIPGLICAAEHYDLPDLLQACFHHAKQFLSIDVVCSMLNSLENYYWRYTSASELVNMILAYVETRACHIFQSAEFITLSESMLQLIINRNLEVPEVAKFEAILTWTKNRIKSKSSSKIDPKSEFRLIMERLSRDIKLHLISPHDLIKVVLPSKAIKNEQILETLMYQVNSGMYRINDSYFQECTLRLQNQDSKYSDVKNVKL